MFDFRIINTAEGTQIIDRSLKTPYNSLTFSQIIEYMEIDKEIAIMEYMKRKTRREAENQRRHTKNILWKIACFCGMV